MIPFIIYERAIVPTPEPHTAIPMANARLRSKYKPTETIAGKYIKAKPTPEYNDTSINQVNPVKIKMHTSYNTNCKVIKPHISPPPT